MDGSRAVTTDFPEKKKNYKGILWKCLCQKLGNLEEMYKFLKWYKLPKLIQEEIGNLIRPKTSKETE